MPPLPALRSVPLAVALLVALAGWGAGCAARTAPAVDDAQTAMRVKTTLLNDPVVGTEDVRVDVVQGVAYLSGRISSDDNRARIEQLARATPGVRDVRIDVELRPELAVLKRRLSVRPPDDTRPRPGLLALGGGVRATASTGGGVDDAVDPTLLVRLGRGEGWSPAVGFGWSSRALSEAPAGNAALADLRVRPVMAGISYTRAAGPASLSLSLVAGYAFNAVRVDTETAGPFRAIDASNGFAWRPSATLWYDASDRVSLQVSAGYLRARPTVTFASDAGLRRERIQADAVTLSVGAVYWVF